MKAQFLTPVVTLFREDGSIDIEANKTLYDYLIGKGLDGLVIMGSTGEFFSMTMEMQKTMIDLAADYLQGRTRVLAGVGRMITSETIELAEYAYDRGLSEVMVVSPYYFKLDENALEHYYDEIADHTRANIFLYNFPDRTVHDLTPGLVLRLAAKHKNIVGIKDTVSVMSHTSSILTALKDEFPDFEVFSGFDDNLAHNVLSGGAGVIGGLSHLIPGQCAAWVKALNDGDMKAAAAGQEFMNRAMAIYDVTAPFIPTVKRGLQLQGFSIQDTCTSPIRTLNNAQEEKLKQILKDLGAL